MMVSCSIKDCKSNWKKSSVINFYRFPVSNEKIVKYWIAATRRNNWTPCSDARICSLHFTDSDFYSSIEHNEKRLKSNVIPTQHVHANILEVLQQDTGHKIKEYNQNNGTSPEEQKLTSKQNDNQITSVVSKCFRCSIYNQLLLENERLRKEIEDLKILQEKRLNQQASMFRTIIHNKEAVLKKKLEMIKNKNKNLNKSIQQTGKNITNLKTVLKDLKRQNILRKDA